MRLLGLGVFIGLFCCGAVYGQAVVESESAVAIDGRVAVVRLVVVGDNDQKAVPFLLELVDTNNNVRATETRKLISVAAGKQTLEFRLPVGEILDAKTQDIAWYRLRYQVGTATGIIAMSQLVRDLFELRIFAGGELAAGTVYRIRVRATDPFKDQSTSGVRVEAVLEIGLAGENDRQIKLNGTGDTDADGFAVIDLSVPPETVLNGEGSVKVTGRKNGIIREALEDVRSLKDDVQFLTMADKPIYQPEQLLNVRGILMKGGDSKTAFGGAMVEFRVADEDDTVLYREKVTTSDFGIAAMSWQIPANAKLGEYAIEIRDAAGEIIGRHRVKVSRYDLPNFAVEAKAAKPYYLPGENKAEVEVNANYLFGKPVTSGSVRVVEEESRQWNWKEQKYDIDEGQVREGKTDAQGRFTATIDLTEQQADLKDNTWRQFKDINFAAYFTDLTTNKTEQRRFDIRLSKEAIHVYVLGDVGRGNVNSTLPFTAYVSTFYADGTPAACDVEIKASEDDEEKFKTVGRLKTSEFGAGKLTLMRPKIGDPDDDLDFRIVATDKAGRRGTRNEDVSFDEDNRQMRVTTDKAIYKSGEMVDVRVVSTVKTGPVYVDVISGGAVIDSRFAMLKNGKASLKIPYLDIFKGELTIAAFAEDDGDDIASDAAGIIFPARLGIALTSETDKQIYKPGEDVSVKYSVVDALGKAIQSALGIVVFDKAVEERARTDADFGGMWRGFYGWLGYGRGFGGFNVKDLNELDLAKPISADMQIVGEIMLLNDYYSPNVFHSNRYYAEAKSEFVTTIDRQFAPVGNELTYVYKYRNFLHPVDQESLRSILAGQGIKLESMRDPWGVAYRTKFSIDKTRDVTTFLSAGPDKIFYTRDDFVAFSTGFDYFTPTGNAIDSAVRSYNARTGNFIRDEKTLFAELDVKEILDRFGHPYKITFEPIGRRMQVRLRSSGPDGKFEEYEWRGDDFNVWTSSIDYFAPTESRIIEAQRVLRTAPLTEAVFRSTLKDAGVDLDILRDGWGNPYYVNVSQRGRYWDKVSIETVQNYGETKITERRVITPVTQQIIEFTIRSRGADGQTGTYDDVTMTQIVHVLSEQGRDDPNPVPVIKPAAYHGPDGSITGTVTDPNGAVITGAKVTATNTETQVARSSVTGSSGSYTISGLAAGKYSVKVVGIAGFASAVISGVSVSANSTTNVNVVLSVATASAVVEVTGDVSTVVDSTESKTQTSITASKIDILPKGVDFTSVLKVGNRPTGTEKENSTPRLREYFPETLLWRPELVTDVNGKAEVKFKTADNITTWKMYTIASTKNGKIGVAEEEFTAFQAFFADLDPPKFLTEGDEIYLPTQVRNYTAKRQKVAVTMAPSAWFSMLTPANQQIEVDSNGSKNAVFGFRASTPIKDGKQRVTAIGQGDSDAIEKPVTVRPNGQEVVRTDSRYSSGGEQSLAVNYPSNALPSTQKLELRVFPNLYSQVTDSVDGLLHRPYGCGEQTISSTYPNLMILKFVKPDAAIAKKARNFLQKGYERLLGYQVADGGFTYWGGKDTSDLALTAYAIRFLTDAGSQIAVDETVIKRASEYLVKQQRRDGSWSQNYRWQSTEDAGRTKLITTYIARSLAMNKAADKDALKKALTYLRGRNNEIDEPYTLALYGLAAIDSGDRDQAEMAARRLESMAIAEGDGVYWSLETNTPFYGWGTAGRIETTALATQLLMRLSNGTPAPRAAGLIGKAMVFLLKNKDRYGVWYSTQTTINVLDTFLAAIGDSRSAEAQRIDVAVNGQPFKTIDVPADQIEPVIIDLNGKVAAGDNNITVTSTSTVPLMSQTVATHYIDWKDADVSGRSVNSSRAIKLDYKCDRQTAAIMQEVTCSVKAERIGFQGYGMLLAEIGTPPGADVSRESLEKAIGNDWNISRYDILPDRIVVYMWAKAGGTSFDFKFKPRYAINAQTPSSVVYDYYNPESQGTVAPMRFTVK